MKNKYMLIILLCIILGTLIGMSIKDIKSKEQLVISKDNITKKEIKITKKSLKKLLFLRLSQCKNLLIVWLKRALK